MTILASFVVRKWDNHLAAISVFLVCLAIDSLIIAAVVNAIVYP